MPPKYGKPTSTTWWSCSPSSITESLSFTSLLPRASLDSRFHLPSSSRPGSPQRKPMEPLGNTALPSVSNATVFHSGLLFWPILPLKSLARR
ncbi:hypothetical protein FQZ97_722320 [compost metagenome]